MIIDERTYTLHVGKVPEYVALYAAEGKAIQWGHLGDPIGWFINETGTLNQIVHMWGFATFEDRTARRGAMLADPAWKAFFAKIQPLIITQENRLLTPAPFSPIR